MISFEPFWMMLKDRKISIYDLEYTYNLNPAEISRLKHNHNFTLKSINRLCQIFHCQPSDIMVYKEYELF
ncbi:MAG: helix-turn-helix transcriptional regulator [Lachnospiraceae bacterium]|nr:helix-turn-helix transcriptional regulator [Lachnospiraceae bacterium]